MLPRHVSSLTEGWSPLPGPLRSTSKQGWLLYFVENPAIFLMMNVVGGESQLSGWAGSEVANLDNMLSLE
jgi:hypothetical protein